MQGAGLHAFAEDADGTLGHDGLGLLAARVAQEVSERRPAGQSDLFPRHLPGGRWRSRQAEIDQQSVAAQLLELLAEVLGLLALGVEGGQDGDDLGHGELQLRVEKRRAAKRAAVSATAFSIGIRSVDDPVQKPWQVV